MYDYRGDRTKSLNGLGRFDEYVVFEHLHRGGGLYRRGKVVMQEVCVGCLNIWRRLGSLSVGIGEKAFCDGFHSWQGVRESECIIATYGHDLSSVLDIAPSYLAGSEGECHSDSGEEPCREGQG